MENTESISPIRCRGDSSREWAWPGALVSDPEIIFADEPTGNLDSRTSREIMALMQKVVKEQGCTLVMVTHDPQLASWADRIIKVIDGKIVSIEVKKKESTEDEEMV